MTGATSERQNLDNDGADDRYNRVQTQELPNRAGKRVCATRGTMQLFMYFPVHTLRTSHIGPR